MNLALVVLAAASGTAQPIPPAAPPPDVRFVKKRTLDIPVSFKPERVKELDKARLFVSKDGGSLYEIGDTIDPTAAGFTYTAKDDGEYWVQMQLVFKDGTLEPKDPSRTPPAEKLVIDTVKPVVTVTVAEMAGDEVVVEWKVDDKHPADGTTRLFYKPTGGSDASWLEAPAGSIKKRAARFKPTGSGPITVQVATADLAGNVGHMNKEVGAKGAVVAAGKQEVAPAPPGGLGGTKDPFGPAPGGPLPPPNFDPTPTPPTKFEPVQPTTPPAEGPKPIATSTVTPPAGIAPTRPELPPADAPAAQFSRSPRFDLNYTLDSGASGVARVDLYVSRDDGRSWVRWSQHDGRETPLKVVLDTRFNKEVEGDYGFVLVPVSGAGLSDGAPVAGTAPDLKVRVDATAPVIKVYAPTADPTNKAALVLNWEATDKNFGRDPIAIEYAEAPQGPWKSVTGTDGPAAARVENSGSYSWQPPLNLASPKVYLRFTAWDLAGNKSEVVTPNPILVDLTKPKARIQGISTK